MNTLFLTGAAQGIGLATANYYYARGWSLGLLDSDETNLEAFAKSKDPQRIRTYVADVSDAAQVKQAIDDFCHGHNGQLEVLINNAGILKVGNFEDLSVDEHRQTISVNVLGVINCMHAALPYLRKARSAVVVNLSSASSSYGVPELASYSASKFAVKALTEALDIEWRKYGIQVCDVVPPFVDTNMLSSQKVTSRALHHMGSHLTADDVVATISKQIEQPILHRPVGWQYAILHHLSSVSPVFIQRWLMRFLSR